MQSHRIIRHGASCPTVHPPPAVLRVRRHGWFIGGVLRHCIPSGGTDHRSQRAYSGSSFPGQPLSVADGSVVPVITSVDYSHPQPESSASPASRALSHWPSHYSRQPAPLNPSTATTHPWRIVSRITWGHVVMWSTAELNICISSICHRNQFKRPLIISCQHP